MSYEIVLSPSEERVTRKALRARFYRRNRYLSARWDGSKYTAISRPLAIVHSPYEDNQKIVWYREGFQVVIDSGESMISGPHKAQLFFIPEVGCPIWLGTTQLLGHFHSDKRLLEQLIDAIRYRYYFMSESSEEDEIVLYSRREDVVVPLDDGPPVSLRGKRICFVEENETTCPKCGKKRASRAALRKHMRIKHKTSMLTRYWVKGDTDGESIRERYRQLCKAYKRLLRLRKTGLDKLKRK